MDLITLIRWGSWVFNSTWQHCRRVKRLSTDLYNLTVNENAWVIGDTGIFFNTNTFINLCNSNWVYKNNLLMNGGESIGKMKKIPLLSCEFTYKEEKVSMDEFLEEIKYIGPTPPLPVLMAAFTIHTKKVYPWRTANFVAFLRDGADVNFTGEAFEIPTHN